MLASLPEDPAIADADSAAQNTAWRILMARAQDGDSGAKPAGQLFARSGSRGTCCYGAAHLNRVSAILDG